MTWKLGLALVAAVALSGCVSLLPKPPPPGAIYSLRAGDVTPVGGDPKPVVISVSEPSAPRSVAGADVVWRKGAEIAFMEGAAWDGTAPDLLQDMLIDIIDRRGAVRTAVRSGGGVRADTDVRWDVLTFEVLEDGSKQEAVIVIAAKLIDLRTRTLIDDERFEAHAPISTRSGRAAAAAMERAARDASLKIADWAAEKAPVPVPPPVAAIPDQPSSNQPRAASTRR